jgi:hypothetical protein
MGGNFSRRINSTFYHHAGGSQSQINYILSSDHELLYNYEIHEKNAINTSSHTSVSATINIQMSRKPKSDTQKIEYSLFVIVILQHDGRRLIYLS